MQWKYKEPTGPKIYPGWKPDKDANFPYLPDERTDDEIEQEKFERGQQQYEIENENPKYENNDW